MTSVEVVSGILGVRPFFARVETISMGGASSTTQRTCVCGVGVCVCDFGDVPVYKLWKGVFVHRGGGNVDVDFSGSTVVCGLRRSGRGGEP